MDTFNTQLSLHKTARLMYLSVVAAEKNFERLISNITNPPAVVNAKNCCAGRGERLFI